MLPFSKNLRRRPALGPKVQRREAVSNYRVQPFSAGDALPTLSGRQFVTPPEWIAIFGDEAAEMLVLVTEVTSFNLSGSPANYVFSRTSATIGGRHSVAGRQAPTSGPEADTGRRAGRGASRPGRPLRYQPAGGAEFRSAWRPGASHRRHSEEVHAAACQALPVGDGLEAVRADGRHIDG